MDYSLLIAPGVYLFTLVVTWFLTKRHFQVKDLELKDKDIESQSSDNISKNIKIYQDMLDDIEARYDASILRRDKQIKQLKLEVQNLTIEIQKLKDK
tara:strand:+ start:526 stop:816 length:291 start_codon:yes stop_codon:yes gene_type:complete